jgi:hypothetical protein
MTVVQTLCYSNGATIDVSFNRLRPDQRRLDRRRALPTGRAGSLATRARSVERPPNFGVGRSGAPVHSAFALPSLDARRKDVDFDTHFAAGFLNDCYLNASW